MNEVITDKDKEYEAMEQSSAPGPDQAMSDRVNNRSLRPRSEAFKEFMTTGWDDNEPAIEPLESSHYIQARLDTLGKAFPGERIVIPAGQPKVRNNDCDYAFRPDTTFSYYTGLGEDYEAGAVLVLNPVFSSVFLIFLLILSPFLFYHLFCPNFFLHFRVASRFGFYGFSGSSVIK